MPDTDDETGAPLGPVGAAYLLGAVAVACCLRLALLARSGSDVTAEHLVWLAVGVVAAAYSAACSVHAGLSAAESRWRRER